MNTIVTKSCNGCGKEASKLYQGDLCVQCLEQSFARLRPMIDHFRSMRQQQPANEILPLPVHGT